MICFLILGLTLITFTPKEILAGRIVGGTEASIEEFPYQVSLQVIHNGKHVHICGGSILSETDILTAAHCILRKRKYFVRYGSAEHAAGGTLLDVKFAVPHERYDADGAITNDVGLLFLNKPIKFSEKASRIELPAPTDTVPVGEMLTVSGWGSLGFGEPTPKHLQKLKIPMVGARECETLAVAVNETMYPGMICAGFVGNGGQGACKGDSGGPLTWKGKLYGVVSWAMELCAKGYPDVYADVAYYRKWIDATRKKYNETIFF